VTTPQRHHSLAGSVSRPTSPQHPGSGAVPSIPSTPSAPAGSAPPPAAVPSSVPPPGTPSSGGELVNGNNLAAALQKRINRKRKVHGGSAHGHHSLQVQQQAPVPHPTTPQTPTATPVHVTGDGLISGAANEDGDGSQDGKTPTPRQSGSMVTHQDDVVTRMKNVEMIELGWENLLPAN